MAAFCPGPLTIIMPRGPEVADECCAGLDTVGIRMPSHPVAGGHPLRAAAPFAAQRQPSGKAQPHQRTGCGPTDMTGRLPLILDGGECDVGVESTVGVGVVINPPLFRPPATSRWEDLERALGEEWVKSPRPFWKSCRRVLWCAARA